MKNTCTALLLLSLSFFASQNALGQRPEKWSSADIHHAIKKVNMLGSALYVAAHPDDENTRLISHLSNGLLMNTAYLSLTRGDGGQNLIGTEIQELLGLIRTQELLAARRTDGGSQLFTRANDFGFSKNPEETQRIWNRDEVMRDIVWAIRKWQPDVIINRFSHDGTRKTHGHHTSSAQLSVEAFDMAADPTVYPEQLKYVNVWKPDRLFFNTSYWMYGSREKFAEVDKSNMVAIDAGMFYPLKGKSNNEIAAESRSMHRSQGFGSVGTRGEELEYLDFIKGTKPVGKSDLFEGINTTWTRVEGGAPIGELLKRVELEFRDEYPAASVPMLMRAYGMVIRLKDGFWKKTKQAELEKIIAACLGLYLEAVADDHSATPGQQVELTIEAINRSPVRCELQAVRFMPVKADTVLNMVLENNQGLKFWKKVTLPADMPLTNPYWLNDAWELGMYTVRDQALRGLPETPRQFRVQFSLVIEAQPIVFEREVVFKRGDDVKGEVYRPFEVVLPVSVNLADEVYLFTDDAPRPVNVLVKSGAPGISGSLSLAYPVGWRTEPASINFDLKLKGEEQLVSFQLFPPKEFAEGKISPMAKVGADIFTRKQVLLEHDHIPTQTVFLNSASKVARLDLKKTGDRIAYIMGAGDKIPESLRQIGYQVDLLDPDSRADISLENLRKYDALVIGVRAYNVVERLKFIQPTLFEYVEQGGTMLVQYNTTGELMLPDEELAPYKLKLSRDRVAVEAAEVRFIAPEHEVLNVPNKITGADFEGWVQERGLYFPNEWGPEFTPILSCNDPGEPAADGGLLVAKHGKGHFIYTGYSWFRELPAGVPGAFRVFVNLLEVGSRDRP